MYTYVRIYVSPYRIFSASKNKMVAINMVVAINIAENSDWKSISAFNKTSNYVHHRRMRKKSYSL